MVSDLFCQWSVLSKKDHGLLYMFRYPSCSISTCIFCFSNEESWGIAHSMLLSQLNLICTWLFEYSSSSVLSCSNSLPDSMVSYVDS